MTGIFLHLLYPIFLAAVLTLYFITIGGVVLKRFLKELPFFEKVTLSFPLGAGSAALSVFLLGSVHQIRFWTFFLLIVLTWILSFRETLSFFREFEEWRTGLPPFSAMETTLLCLLLAHFLLHLLYSLAPPVGFDAVYYHLVMAKRYAEAHFLLPQPDIRWSFGPQLHELLMALGLALHSDRLTSLVMLILSLWLVGTLYQLGRRFLDRETSCLAAALFWCMPLVSYYAPLLKNDLGTTLFVMLACDQWLALTRNSSPGRLLLLSVFSGFAVSSKFTAFPPVAVIAVATLWSLRKYRNTSGFQRTFLFSLFLFGALYLPYFLRSALLTGNPLYPNAYRIFGGRLWNSEMDQAFLKRHMGSKNFLQFLVYPVQFSLAEIYGGHVGTPLFLAFLPLLFLWRPLDTSLKKILGISFFIYSVSYLCFDTHSRYYFSVFSLLSFPAACAIQMTRREGKFLRSVGFFSVGLFFLLNFGITFAFTRDRIPSALGLESRESYLLRTLPYHPVVAYANAHTEENDRILINDIPGYYLQRNIHIGSPYSGEILFYTLKTPESLSYKLEELGIRYVILREQPSDLLNWKLMDDLRRKGILRLVFEKNGIGLYRFVPNGENESLPLTFHNKILNNERR